jgi:hypothetical protein
VLRGKIEKPKQSQQAKLRPRNDITASVESSADAGERAGEPTDKKCDSLKKSINDNY